MEKLVLFLTVLAWIFGILSTVIFLGAVYLNVTYIGSLQESLDALRGKTRTYRAGVWLLIAIICWTFIIVF